MVLYKGEQRIDQLPEMLHEFGQAKIFLCSFIFFSYLFLVLPGIDCQYVSAFI